MKDFAETLLFPGFWKFASRTFLPPLVSPAPCSARRRFINEASRYVPALR